MKTLLACLFIVASWINSYAVSDPREAFWMRESSTENAVAAAKDSTFFLRIVVGGSLVETATYEVSYRGDIAKLDLGNSNEASGLISRRDPQCETHLEIGKVDLAHFIRNCIDQELFALEFCPKNIEAPNVLKCDGNDFWVYIKYGQHESHFHRTDNSIPVSSVYYQLKKLIQSAWAQSAAKALSQQTTPSVEIAISATIAYIDVASPKYADQRIRTQLDSRFDLVVKINSCSPAVLEFQPGTKVVFGIHSPTRFFATDGENAVGKSFDFLLTREKIDGKTKFSNLRSKPSNHP